MVEFADIKACKFNLLLVFAVMSWPPPHFSSSSAPFVCYVEGSNDPVFSIAAGLVEVMQCIESYVAKFVFSLSIITCSFIVLTSQSLRVLSSHLLNTVL